jgi:hypothetical protein
LFDFKTKPKVAIKTLDLKAKITTILSWLGSDNT